MIAGVSCKLHPGGQGKPAAAAAAACAGDEYVSALWLPSSEGPVLPQEHSQPRRRHALVRTQLQPCRRARHSEGLLQHAHKHTIDTSRVATQSMHSPLKPATSCGGHLPDSASLSSTPKNLASLSMVPHRGLRCWGGGERGGGGAAVSRGRHTAPRGGGPPGAARGLQPPARLLPRCGRLDVRLQPSPLPALAAECGKARRCAGSAQPSTAAAMRAALRARHAGCCAATPASRWRPARPRRLAGDAPYRWASPGGSPAVHSPRHWRPAIYLQASLEPAAQRRVLLHAGGPHDNGVAGASKPAAGARPDARGALQAALHAAAA